MCETLVVHFVVTIGGSYSVCVLEDGRTQNGCGMSNRQCAYTMSDIVRLIYRLCAGAERAVLLAVFAERFTRMRLRACAAEREERIEFY